jgi:hypothetical protein
MRVSSVETSQRICLTKEEVGLLVDRCHAEALAELIASSPQRREQVDPFLWPGC